ncbi:hypothetical protein PV10_05922 [Exophiala mesophila]|uniref:D-xylose reductase [NAD(P)H] n=1 Tax=Exophiala mesophila TaxID=212818 RepID=A0A0D1ZX32_EXOME|nr:uncharacterized protein PV10_05922 [Exophiala mesophila]KIV91378.1 hypothetical protein PV10_05922 [Exophiala mesophila]
MGGITFDKTLPLTNSSLTIPQLGFGVYLSPADVCKASCLTALNVGYRHIDTAQFYANEAQVGQALKESGLNRSDVFITTKILSASGSVDKSYQKCLDSIRKIDDREDGYVDLFLIHSPNAGSKARKEMWLALEKLLEQGKAKSIGVSNFGVRHINELKSFATTWPPPVNQIELHPWCQQRSIVSYCEKNNIVIEAYSPLVRNYKANDPTLVSLAKKHDKTTAQILIRYSLQKGWVPLPKSDSPEYIKQNADVFDFELDGDDMKTLDDLDQGDAGAIVQAVSND